MIVSDLLTKKFTIRITKKSSGTKMNPYQPPRNENPIKVCLKSVAISFIATIAMVIAILVYFFVVGSVVRWLN